MTSVSLKDLTEQLLRGSLDPQTAAKIALGIEETTMAGDIATPEAVSAPPSEPQPDIRSVLNLGSPPPARKRRRKKKHRR